MVDKNIFTTHPCIFSTELKVRISQINFGQHLDNAELIKMAHEARFCFLDKYGFNEVDIEGVGLVIGNLEVDYVREVFLHDILTFSLYLDELKKYSLQMYYLISSAKQQKIVARVRTKLIFFDYAKRVKDYVPKFFQQLMQSQ